MKSSLDPSLEHFATALMKRKVVAPIMLDVRQLTSLADVFFICSGRSSRQVSAISELVQRDLKQCGIRPLSIEGDREGLWVLMDYGHVVIHIFYEPVRAFYDMEGLWADAKRLSIGEFVKADFTEED